MSAMIIFRGRAIFMEGGRWSVTGTNVWSHNNSGGTDLVWHLHYHDGQQHRVQFLWETEIVARSRQVYQYQHRYMLHRTSRTWQQPCLRRKIDEHCHGNASRDCTLQLQTLYLSTAANITNCSFLYEINQKNQHR